MIPFTSRVSSNLSSHYEMIWYDDDGDWVIDWLVSGHYITYKKDKQYLLLNNFQKQKLWWEKRKYPWTAQSHWCWGDLHRVLLNCQNKLARLGALCHRYIKLHALNVTFFAQLFLEFSVIISLHHYDTLIHKCFISWWLRLVKFHILARFLFLPPSKAEQGPPRRSHACATP